MLSAQTSVGISDIILINHIAIVVVKLNPCVAIEPLRSIIEGSLSMSFFLYKAWSISVLGLSFKTMSGGTLPRFH